MLMSLLAARAHVVEDARATLLASLSSLYSLKRQGAAATTVF
jgi:hypothetical protein